MKHQMRHLYWYKAALDRVIDGDTVVLHIDLGLDVYTQTTVRLSGIDAPELTGNERAAGLLAKQYLTELLTDEELEIHTIKDRTGKYGRLLADIYVEGDYVQQQMVTAGHAVPR